MKVILFILGFAAYAFAQTPTITCASGTNRVQEGQSITCTSTAPVTWSLVGATGSLSSQTSTSVAFTAPASIAVNHVMAGCPVTPNDSIWNTRIDNLPVNPNSATWISGVVAGDPITTTNVNFGELSWGISTSNASTPTRNLINTYGGSTSGFPIPSGMNLKEESGAYHSTTDQNDHHIMNVRMDNCQFFELYNLRPPTAAYSHACNGGTPYDCNVQSSVSYNWSDYTTNNGISGTDAASLLLAPLTMHLSDFYNGSMNHPLRFTSCIGCATGSTFLWPAGSGNGSRPGTGLPPMGALFRLRLCGVGGVSTSCATLSSYSAYQQILLTALHNYGMYLADIGTITAVTPGTDISLDRNVLAAVDSLGIPIGDFEVVDQSSLQYGANSYEVCPFNATCMGARNTYEAPANQAIIVATPTGGGSAVSTPIAIQGVTIGLNTPTLWMEAGSYTYQIPSWVNGTSNQSVTWTEISGPGSVTSGGVYTPPTNLPPTLGNPSLATNPGLVLEMGVKFKADTSGSVTGIRFYKLSGMTGTHIGRLWSCGDQTTCATGTQLASATFTSETASGWQDVQFSSPVSITANTYYVVSYTAPDGSISVVPNGLLSGADNAPLHFPAEGVMGHNGVFAGGAGVFPNAANPSEFNWCVDLDFQTTIGGTTYNMYSGSTTAVLKATSAADTNATVYEYIYLLPQGVNPTNSIRIDSGNYTGVPFTDGNGNVWQPDGALEDTSPGCCGTDAYPGWQNFLTNAELGVYETEGYGGGSVNDMQYTFILPNGNYKVRAMYGTTTGASPSGATLSTSPPTPAAWRLHFETQNDIKLHNFNPLLNGPAGYAWEVRVPTDIYVPAKVTNNILQFANRAVFYDVDVVNGICETCGSNNTINGLEIIPDSTPAHWAIDTQQQSTVTAGSSIWQPLTNTGGAWEFGTAFIPTQSGYIAGLRFYKASGDTGTHTGSLWSILDGPLNSQTGSLLATGTFSGETATGWQTMIFSSPVAVTAGYQYVISYNSPTGTRYQANYFFTQPLVQPFINGPLEGFMGLYAASSGGVFPANTASSMFAVDPIFSLSSSGTNPVTLFPTIGLPGQQLQFYVEDWYTGVNDPTWSIVSGPGTIQAGTNINGSPVAIYTAPWTLPAAGSAVVIKAQSQSNPAISAIARQYFTGATNGVAK